MTRLLTFVLLAIMIGSCNYQPSEKFVVNTYAKTLNATIIQTYLLKGKYYCVTDSNRYICFDQTFEIDSEITALINIQHFDYTFSWGDTLFAGISTEDTIPRNFYLDSAYKWQPVVINHNFLPSFYEDELYRVSSCCVGEFGGAAYFTNKKNMHVYSFPATCLTSVNKIGSTFYVTTSLAHLSGFTEIFKIEDPSKLYELPDSLKNHCNWWSQFVSSQNYDAEIKRFEIGTQKLIDTMGGLTLTSFVFKDQLYHINTDWKKTFISKIQGDSLLILDSISNKPLWKYNSFTQTRGEKNLYSFHNDEVSGFWVISNDTISIVTFDNFKK